MTQEEKRAKHREYIRRWNAAHPDYYKTPARKALALANNERFKARHPNADREKAKRWRERHPEDAKESKAKYRSSEHGKKKERKSYAEWYALNRDKKNAYKRAYAKAHRPMLREKERVRMATDIQFKIRKRLSGRILCAVRRKRGCKSASTKELIGCDFEFLRGYLEARFTLGMTWENYGEWHVDHRIPCAEFDLTNSDQQRQCFHYSNLQPMWSVENLTKNRFPPAPHQAELI